MRVVNDEIKAFYILENGIHTALIATTSRTRKICVDNHEKVTDVDQGKVVLGQVAFIYVLCSAVYTMSNAVRSRIFGENV